MNLLKEYITAFIKFYNKIKKSTYISQYDLFEQEELKKCFEYFKKYYPSSIFLGTDELREYSINKSLENIKDNADVLFLEFGVYKGKTLNFFAKKIKEFLDLILSWGLKMTGMDIPILQEDTMFMKKYQK